MKKVLVLGTGGQGKKYINYFLKNNYEVFGICKTEKTKNNIQKKYNIKVTLDYKKNNYNNFDIIIISLPPEIQGRVSLEILESGYYNKMIIEIPVTWNKWELDKIKEYNNAFFFLEEYYTLISQFLRKIEIKKIERININIILSKKDYINLEARKVSLIHVNNNFLGTGIKIKKDYYNFEFHNSEDIFYEIYIEYNKTKVIYVFNKEKYLKIGNKKIIDNYNFDNVLSKVILFDNNFSKYYNIKNVG